VSDPATLTLAEARSRLERKDVSAAELAQACRARIGRWQPRINAFIDTELRHAAGASGALAGIPLAHKDMFYRAGRVSNCGSKIRKGWVARETAAVLERLDATGAADIGTLNMSEFAYGPTGHNEHWGDCGNPWQPEYITGGSSSGSAAAVAARLVFGALGSDTGGSVRLPAAACGVTGLKTTWGRVSRHGAMPLSHSLDTIGPLARTAEDCALIFQAIAGHDERDSITSRSPVQVDIGRRPLRIALSSDWIETNAHPEVARALLGAAKALGASIEVAPPPFETLSAHCLTVMQAEASAQHLQWMRTRSQDYSSAVRVRLEAGYPIPAAQYLEVLRLRARWVEEFIATTLADADMYLCPTIAVPIPTREETGPRGGPEMPKRLAEVTRLTRWVNYLGVPSLSVPCGFDSRGLPIGLQLVGRPLAEGVLLAAGHAYQAETDWHRRLPPE
jgi:aspartyl-tRNA(Asn)/glutamyl-tRNA(Gln) amidotransferase subunit A